MIKAKRYRGKLMSNDFIYHVKLNDKDKPEPTLNAEKAIEYKIEIEKLLLKNECLKEGG